MCMEDIRIGENSPAELKLINLAAGNTTVLPPNGNRQALHIETPTGGTVHYSPRRMTAANQGIRATSGISGLHMYLHTYGHLVQEAVNLFAAAPIAVTVTEVTLPDKQEFPRDV